MSARVAELTDAGEDDAIETVRDDAPAKTPPAKTSVEDQDDMPLPTEPRTIFLGGLFLLALLAALYVASPIVLPVVLAIVLKLLLQPLVRLTDRAGLPHALGALLAILLLVAAIAALISGVAGPAAAWAGKLPEAIPQIQQQLAFLARPIGSFQWMMGQLQNVAGGGGRRAAGAVGALVQRHGRAVQRHHHGCGRPVHHPGGAVLPAGLGRDLHAPLRRDPADLRREASGG